MEYFKAFLIFFFTFFVVLIAGELFRAQNYQEMVYKEIQIASLDAIASTVDEQLKQDDILYIENPDETKNILETLIQDNLRVSLVASVVLEEDYYIHSIKIKDLVIKQGKYHFEGEKPVQDEYPEIIVNGNFDLLPFIARMNEFYWNLDIKNRTEYIFAR